MILETKDFGIRSQNFAHRACSGRKTDAGLLPIRIEMQTLKETIRSWAQETARHRKSKQDGTGQGFGETMNEIAATFEVNRQTLREYLRMVYPDWRQHRYFKQPCE